MARLGSATAAARSAAREGGRPQVEKEGSAAGLGSTVVAAGLVAGEGGRPWAGGGWEHLRRGRESSLVAGQAVDTPPSPNPAATTPPPSPGWPRMPPLPQPHHGRPPSSAQLTVVRLGEGGTHGGGRGGGHDGVGGKGMSIACQAGEGVAKNSCWQPARTIGCRRCHFLRIRFMPSL